MKNFIIFLDEKKPQSNKILFRKPEKKEADRIQMVQSSVKKPVEDCKLKDSQKSNDVKIVKNSRLLSFDDEEEDN